MCRSGLKSCLWEIKRSFWLLAISSGVLWPTLLLSVFSPFSSLCWSLLLWSSHCYSPLLPPIVCAPKAPNCAHFFINQQPITEPGELLHGDGMPLCFGGALWWLLEWTIMRASLWPGPPVNGKKGGQWRERNGEKGEVFKIIKRHKNLRCIWVPRGRQVVYFM